MNNNDSHGLTRIDADSNKNNNHGNGYSHSRGRLCHDSNGGNGYEGLVTATADGNCDVLCRHR